MNKEEFDRLLLDTKSPQDRLNFINIFSMEFHMYLKIMRKTILNSETG